MPRIDMTIEGADLINAKLADLGPKLNRAVAQGLFVLANVILTDSKQVVPVDTGNLESTGAVGRYTEGSGVEAGPPYDEGSTKVVYVGYGSSAVNYALTVHEMLDTSYIPGMGSAHARMIHWKRPGSGPKYLENPFKAHQDELPDRIKAAITEVFSEP
jgi:hypothetical protein